MIPKHRLLVSVAAIAAGSTLASAAQAQAGPPTNLVSVCSGVSLPRSVVTDIIAPVANGIVTPTQPAVNDLLAVLPVAPPLAIDTAGLLAGAAAGQPITLQALDTNGNVVAPAAPCNAQANSYALATPAGVSIGGNGITGLGSNGQPASAGTVDAIAIGNRAATDPGAGAALALGTGALVNPGATNSVALGTGATATSANSVALGAGSTATRGAPEVSVGAPGAERLLTNVAAGIQPTDGANVGQVNAVAGNLAALAARAVTYDDATLARATLAGANGTVLTNVAAGTVAAGSTDAVNGGQLAAVSTRVDANTAAITNLGATVAGNTTAITSLTTAISNGAVGPVRYSSPAAPTTPDGGVPSQDVTLVGAAAGAVGLHNVAAGVVAAGSTDAVNGDQLAAVRAAGANAVSYDTNAAGVRQNSVTLAGGTAGAVTVRNVAAGTVAAGSTDAVNGGQLAATQATAASALALGQNAVQYDSGRGGVTLDPGGAAAAIHNVAAGTSATDAASVGQLNGGLATALGQAETYTDTKLAAVSFDVRNARRDAAGGSATALAAAGLPQAFTPGASMIAIGGGTYGGQSAIALGISKVFGDGHTIVRLSGSRDTRGRSGANGGIGYQF